MTVCDAGLGEEDGGRFGGEHQKILIKLAC